MKKLAAILLLLAVIAVGREKGIFRDEVPAQILESMKENGKIAETSQIWEYDYDGQKVYLLSFKDPSKPELVLTENANVLCINNDDQKNDILFEKFINNRKNERLLWHQTN